MRSGGGSESRRAGRAATRALGAALLVGAALSCVGEVPQRVGPGAPAPEYGAALLDGDSLSLASLEGTPVLLNVWATWCHPCREEMPDLQALSERYRDRGLRVLGVSIDQRGSDEAIRAFLGEAGVDFTILLDPRDVVSRRFQAMGVPETYLIDREGVIRKRWIGRFEPLGEETIEAVEGMLGFSPPRPARRARAPNGRAG